MNIDFVSCFIIICFCNIFQISFSLWDEDRYFSIASAFTLHIIALCLCLWTKYNEFEYIASHLYSCTLFFKTVILTVTNPANPVYGLTRLFTILTEFYFAVEFLLLLHEKRKRSFFVTDAAGIRRDE